MTQNPRDTRSDMPDEYRVSGILPRDLSNAVSDAMHAALERGMTTDEACCMVASVAADYWRSAFGNGSLNKLAKIIIARSKEPMPDAEGATE